jgi:hypothetical protein
VNGATAGTLTDAVAPGAVALTVAPALPLSVAVAVPLASVTGAAALRVPALDVNCTVRPDSAAPLVSVNLAVMVTLLPLSRSAPGAADKLNCAAAGAGDGVGEGEGVGDGFVGLLEEELLPQAATSMAIKATADARVMTAHYRPSRRRASRYLRADR